MRVLVTHGGPVNAPCLRHEPQIEVWPCSAQRAKELADLIRQELGRLERCEVAAARHLGPAGDVEEVFGLLAASPSGVIPARLRNRGTHICSRAPCGHS
jgi:hypothetical protein